MPQCDLGAALAEARRCVRELGFRGVMMRPNPVRARTLGDPYWDPLWSLLEELDVPLAVHEGTTQDLPQSGRDRFENYALRHVCSHPHEQQIACAALVMGGVLERHPGLRVDFLESGCGWLPHWLERMDEHVHGWGHAIAKLPLAPSEYFRRQCFVSCDPNERTLPSVVALAGEDVVGVRHRLSAPGRARGRSRRAHRGAPELSPAAREKILRRNAQRCFGLA